MSDLQRALVPFVFGRAVFPLALRDARERPRRARLDPPRLPRAASCARPSRRPACPRSGSGATSPTACSRSRRCRSEPRTGAEVVVVGGGPAGSALACLLARRGHDVLLLEAKHFPRDQVCGESVSPEGWRLAGADRGPRPRARARAPARARHAPHVAGRHELHRPLPERAARASPLRRLALDAALCSPPRATRARASSRERASTSSSSTPAASRGSRPSSPVSRCAVRARLVAGADGRRSVVARRLGLLRDAPATAALRRARALGGGRGPQRARRDARRPRAATAASRRSHRRSRTSPSCSTRASWATSKATSRASTGATLRAALAAASPSGWSARACSSPRARSARSPSAAGRSPPRGRVLLGDAAGFYDPFTGEGVTLALRGAELVATAARRGARARRDRAAAAAFVLRERARHAATRDKFRFNHRLQLAVRWPAAANAIARRLRAAPRPRRPAGGHRRRFRARARGPRAGVPARPAHGLTAPQALVRCAVSPQASRDNSSPLRPAASRPGDAPLDLPHDAPVAPARRQGDPAQAAEPDLLPDQRRRPRGGAGRGRAACCGPGTTGSTPTTATARCCCSSA